MLRSYLVLAFRSLRKRVGYTAINVVGLAVGLAACLLITLYIHEQTSYDRHYPGAESIVRLGVRFGEHEVAVSPSLLAPMLRREVPTVRAAARLYDVANFGDVVVEHDGRRFAEDAFLYADSTVFDVLEMPFAAGDPSTALARPGTIVLTASAARTYFGDDDPLGATLLVDGVRTFEVTGVLADPPATTHLPYRFVASLETLRSWGELSDDELRGAQFLTYVRLAEDASVDAFRAQLGAFVDRTFGEMRERAGTDVAVLVHPLLDLHLRHGTGSATHVAAATVIALLLLLVACVNFVNLATARSAERAREVGVRKVAGARRGALVAQFLAEAAVLSLAAGVAALLLAALALPAFRTLTGGVYDVSLLTDAGLVALVLGTAVGVGLIAGLYPAAVLSGFTPAEVLKGSFRASARGRRLRTGLVVFQFGVVVVLLVGTFVVQRQLGYVKAKDLGFDKEHVLVLPLSDGASHAALDALTTGLRGVASVEALTPISSVPGDFKGGYRLQAEGTDASLDVVGIFTGAEVVETLDLELVAGEGMPAGPPAAQGEEHAFLLNEESVRRLGWTPEEAVGRRADLHGRVGAIRGVVRDFHYATLHEAIDPLVFFAADEGYSHLLVRMTTVDLAATVGGVRAVWARVLPSTPFDVRFLDDEFDALYRAEERAGRIFAVFAGLAIFVACLGLFGLALFTTQQRTKEIGIRKVLGATVGEIVVLFTRDVAGLVVAAFVLAAPVGYLVMQRWLEGFAYRVALPWTAFALALAVALGLAVSTVALQARRAAVADPVETLRYE